jgi:hypothetical protein
MNSSMCLLNNNNIILERYLFLRKNFNKVIKNLEQIIYIFNNINDSTNIKNIKNIKNIIKINLEQIINIFDDMGDAFTEETAILFEELCENAIRNNIIESDDCLNPIIWNLPQNINNLNKKFFYHKIQAINYLKKKCDEQIEQLCSHNFIEDTIDITPDFSKNIKYCCICEYTQN